MMDGSDFDRRIGELLHEYGPPQVSVAELLCDRHDPASVAFTVIDADGSSADLTFGELADRSRRIATALARMRVGPGDRVATLMSKSIDFPVALLAIWRLGAVHVPLFTAFAEPAVTMRLEAADARVVFVDGDQARKLASFAGERIVAGATADECAGSHRFESLVREDGPREDRIAVGGSAPFIRLFTSGTTGDPKGVVIPVRALAAFVAYAEFGLDLTAHDVFWNAADPGWAYGLYYAICAPLALGRRSLLLHAPFTPALTYDVLERFGVTNFAAAPTVYRALRNDASAAKETPALRHASSAGEPLNADIVTWARDALGTPVHDHYGQTELGMVAINAHAPGLTAPLRPGSMGRAMPGFTLAVLRPDAATIAEPGELGRVAVDLHASPLMWFEAYADAPERTAERFVGDRWYLTGDAGHMDADGYVFFSARDDDVIIMAGYRIGPFEIESVLLEHAAVAEAAVVGVPDEIRGEVVVAFVVVSADAVASDALAADLQRHVKERYAAHAYPRTVTFVNALPKTPSGKVQRYLLRAGHANTPTGSRP
jgi:acetyl-CoA synthetase